MQIHLRDGLDIPEGWAIDPEGNPTTDPEAGLAGAQLPFGGHKGAACLLYTSPSPRDRQKSRMPSSA